MEISSSSSSEFEGLEKEDEDDEEEIFDSSGKGEKKNHHQLGEFLPKVVKRYPKLEQFFCFVLKNLENSPSLSS